MKKIFFILTLLVIPSSVFAQCIPPECINNIRGKVVFIPSFSSSLRLAGQALEEPIDISRAYLEWDFNSTDMADDMTLPCCVSIPVTPTPLDASMMTYRVSGVDATTIISPTILMINNVTCSLMACWTPPLIRILPNLGRGGTFTIRISREWLPRFHESIWSDPVSFTVGQIIDPPPPICIVSQFEEWSPWTPVIPPTPPVIETRHRNRVITNAPCVGTPNLTEVENRNILVAPPVKQCPYVATGQTVNVPKNVGTVIETFRQPVSNRARVGTFLYWYWKVEINPIDSQFDHIKVTCQGPP